MNEEIIMPIIYLSFLFFYTNDGHQELIIMWPNDISLLIQ